MESGQGHNIDGIHNLLVESEQGRNIDGIHNFFVKSGQGHNLGGIHNFLVESRQGHNVDIIAISRFQWDFLMLSETPGKVIMLTESHNRRRKKKSIFSSFRGQKRMGRILDF